MQVRAQGWLADRIACPSARPLSGRPFCPSSPPGHTSMASTDPLSPSPGPDGPPREPGAHSTPQAAESLREAAAGGAAAPALAAPREAKALPKGTRLGALPVLLVLAFAFLLASFP